MLGIRPDSDQFFLNHTAKRSQSFANRYTGRFFVSGVSGGFAKYQKQQDEGKEGYEKPPKPYKYTYQPVLERNQREELRRDAERLMELEEKLAEIQRVKEKKRQRDRQRRRKKMEFLAAQKIQSVYRSYHERKMTNAVEIMKNFLQAVKAQQAIYTANWALSVLKRFAMKVSESRGVPFSKDGLTLSLLVGL